MKRNDEEHKIQVAICAYLDFRLPPDATYWAVPNGGARTRITGKNGRTFSLEGKRLKDEGVKSGVSDLMILWAGRLICIEVKAAKGRQSENQKEWEQTAIACGAVYRVVKSLDDVKGLLDMLGCVKPKSRLGAKGLAEFERTEIDDWLGN
jgi:hypothetical protein